MRAVIVCFVAVIASFAGNPSVFAQAPSGSASTGSVEKGRVIFLRVGCAQCHGREAQGSPTTGPRLGPGGLAAPAFSRYVRAPRLQMPPYTEKVLSDADLADIIAFVASRPKAATPSLLRQQP